MHALYLVVLQNTKMREKLKSSVISRDCQQGRVRTLVRWSHRTSPLLAGLCQLSKHWRTWCCRQALRPVLEFGTYLDEFWTFAYVHVPTFRRIQRFSWS